MPFTPGSEGPQIDPREVIDLTRKLIQIDSVSGNERQISGFIADCLTSNGIVSRVVDAAEGRPNVYAKLGTARSSLLFNGHVDTVPIGNGWTRDALGGEESDGRLYGRGASDMKSGLAAMMAALITSRRQTPNPAGAIEFQAVIDEEVSSLGVKAAIAAGVEAPHAVIAEPTELQTICAAKGNCYFVIRLQGRAAHAGSPEFGLNAIAAAADLIKAIERHDAELAYRRHPLLGRPYVTATGITGGTGASSVPDCCEITLDRRLLPGETGYSALDDIQSFLRHAVPDALPFDVRLTMELPAMDLAPEHLFVEQVRRTSVACGAPARPAGGWSAACDGGHLYGAGIPTVLFGPGSITREAHRPDESVSIDEILIAAKTYAALAAAALRAPDA